MGYPYFEGYLKYIEITRERIRIKMDYWLLFDGFVEYSFKDRPRHVWRSLQRSAERRLSGNEEWFIEYEKAVRKLHIGDVVRLTLKHSTDYQIEKL